MFLTIKDVKIKIHIILPSKNFQANGTSKLPQANDDSKRLGSQWRLEGVPHPQIGEMDNILKVSHPPGQNPRSMHHNVTLG